jgi:7-cyano-7-deazaguanine synthase
MKKAHTGCKEHLVFVLASGGIDSTGCLSFYLDQQDDVEALFIDYGQAARKQEFRAVSSICDHLGIPLNTIRCAGASRKTSGMIYGRNAFLLYLALMEFPSNHGIISIGIHSGTQYYDCSPQFISSLQKVFDLYTNGAVRIGVPFLTWLKPDILAFCQQRDVPLSLTYSCELGLNQPCGKCTSCRDLEALNVFA